MDWGANLCSTSLCPRHSYMGWLRLVGFLKLQYSFAGYSLFNRAHLQKVLIILRSLLASAIATPILWLHPTGCTQGVYAIGCLC